MGEANRGGEARLDSGALPKPKVFDIDFADYRARSWIGMEVQAPDGRTTTFLHWANFRSGQLTDPQTRHELAAFVARVKVQHGVDTAIGRAVDRPRSDPGAGEIGLIDDEDMYGVYVDQEQRVGLSPWLLAGGLGREDFLRWQDPEGFEQAYQGALSALPGADQDSLVTPAEASEQP